MVGHEIVVLGSVSPVKTSGHAIFNLILFKESNTSEKHLFIFLFLILSLHAQCSIAGAYHLELSTALYFCHSVFTDKSIFSLNLPRTRAPHKSTSTNQD